MNSLWYGLYFLVFPGFLFTLLVGLVATWIDRKVTARIQWRVGPPVLQPVYDLAKLFGKEVVMPATAQRWVFAAAPLIGVIGTVLASMVLGLAAFFGISFMGDLIVLIYLLLFPSLAIIIGGSASGNPHSSIGASREMKLILAYELPLVLAVVTVIINSGFSLDLVEIASRWTLGSVSGFLAFIVSIICIQAKMAQVPFDLPEAETEIMEGPLLEYSGALLGMYKMIQAMLFYVLPLYVIVLFMGGVAEGWGYPAAVLKYILLVVIVVLVKNTNPRLRIDQAVKFFWTKVFSVALLAVIFATLGHLLEVSWL